MYLSYLDESGDKGFTNSPTRFFVLSCALVHDSDWLKTLDGLVDLRRTLKTEWGIPVRAELKSEHFKTGHGPFKGLNIGLRDRMKIYGSVMDYQAAQLSMTTFAVAVEKANIVDRSKDARYRAWTFALQRIDRFCEAKGDRAMIFPDEGHAVFIRKLLRQVRRFQMIHGHYGGLRNIPVTRIVEDPHDKHSQDSFFTQVADWNAYAAHRSSYVDPIRRVPGDLWDRLGATLLLDVNKVKGGPPGIVRWP